MKRFFVFFLLLASLVLFSTSEGAKRKKKTPVLSEARKGKTSKKTKKRRVDITKVLNSRAVSKIHKRQARRMTAIKGYKRKGIIGEKENGLLAIRSMDKLSKKEKSRLRRIVDRENRDRNKLYQIISRASGHSKKEATFLRLNMFQSHLEVDLRGTYYFEKGRWQQK